MLEFVIRGLVTAHRIRHGIKTRYAIDDMGIHVSQILEKIEEEERQRIKSRRIKNAA